VFLQGLFNPFFPAASLLLSCIEYRIAARKQGARIRIPGGASAITCFWRVSQWLVIVIHVFTTIKT